MSMAMGYPDLITTSSTSGAIFTVQLSNATGTFTQSSTITLPSTIVVAGLNGPVTVNTATASVSTYAVGDLDGDGKADLAFALSNLPTVPTSGPSTIFPYAVYCIALSKGDGTFNSPVAAAFAFGLGAWLLGRRRIPRGLIVVLLTVLAGAAFFGLAGCGGSSSKTVTSTVTITGTSGSTSRTASYTLTASN